MNLEIGTVGYCLYDLFSLVYIAIKEYVVYEGVALLRMGSRAPLPSLLVRCRATATREPLTQSPPTDAMSPPQFYLFKFVYMLKLPSHQGHIRQNHYGFERGGEVTRF